MDFKVFADGIKEDWGNLFECEIEKDEVCVSGLIHLDTYDEEAYLVAYFNNDGSLYVTFAFEGIQPSLEIYRLINDFNNNVGYIKAYIRKDGKLAIDYEVHKNPSEEVARIEFKYAMLKVVDDSVSKYLLPITEYTCD